MTALNYPSSRSKVAPLSVARVATHARAASGPTVYAGPRVVEKPSRAGRGRVDGRRAIRRPRQSSQSRHDCAPPGNKLSTRARQVFHRTGSCELSVELADG